MGKTRRGGVHRVNAVLKKQITDAGLTTSWYFACMWKLNMMRSGYEPELFKRHIYAEEKLANGQLGNTFQWHIDVFSVRGAGCNAPALLRLPTIVSSREFVRVLNSKPGRQHRVNPFGVSLYCIGTGKSEEWATGGRMKQFPWAETPPLLPEAEPYVQYCYPGEAYNDLKKSAVGILFDSKVMHLEDCVECEAKRVLMSGDQPLIAVQSRIIRLEKPYLWRDVSMSSQCTGYIAGAAGRPGSCEWAKCSQFVLDNAEHFLAVRQFYHGK